MKHLMNLKPLTICVALVCGVLLLASGISTAASPEHGARYGGAYRIPLASEPTTLDPAKFSDIYAMNVATNIFDGLVEFDNHLNVIPAIAKVWKISRDHKVYTFRLRRGVKFHNGREVTAHDFVYSFTRLLDPQIKSPAAFLFKNIQGAQEFAEGQMQSVEGLQARDLYTLVIRLKEPFAPFLSILAMANSKVVPQEAIGGTFDRHPVGTGPFIVQKWQPGKEILLNANQNYYAGRPYLDEIRFSIYQNVDWQNIFTAFEAGSLDQSLIPSSSADPLIAKATTQSRNMLVSKPGLNVVYVGLNMNLAVFKDRRVRQAIYYAVNREQIVQENARWRSVPATGILPPGIAGYDPHFNGYSYDPAKAKQLLAQAGYPEGRGIPVIELWTVSKSVRVREQLEAYQRYLAEIGVQVELKLAENWKDFISRIKQNQAGMFYAAWYADFPDPDNFLYTLCHSKSRVNRTGYKNAKIDKMLDEARSEVDYMKRARQYREIERHVMEDAPLISQHYNSFNYVFQPWVQGVNLNHLGGVYLPLRKVWIDHQQYAKHLALAKDYTVR